MDAIANSLFDSIVEEYESESDWLEARKSFIGASEVAAIFGVGYASQSPITVWASKTDGPRQEIPAEQLRRMNRGKKLEPIIAGEFEQETGLTAIDPGDFTVYRHLEFPWIAATLDRYTIHDDFGPVPVELKAVNGRFRGDWDTDEEPPLKYLVQVQTQMAVTGTSHCYLVGLIGGDEVVVRLLERNQRFIEAMIPKLREFWGYVQRNEMPPVDDSEATRAMLGLIYPHDTGLEIDLPADFIDLDRELLEIKAQIKTLETRKDGIENKLKAAIGAATRGCLPSGSYSWKAQTRTTIDAESLRAEFPAIAEQFSKVSSFRVLRRSNK